MRIYQCDFCKEQKPCTKTNIDGKNYDMCQQCRDKRDKQLEGRGEPYYGFVGNSFIYTWPYPYQQPYVITTTTPATTPTITYQEPYQTGNTCQLSS